MKPLNASATTTALMALAESRSEHAMRAKAASERGDAEASAHWEQSARECDEARDYLIHSTLRDAALGKTPELGDVL